MPPETYRRFLRRVDALKRESCLALFDENRQAFQIKKEKTIAKNLERIFNAALEISNRKGFHAMSMRDLSRESGFSVGALYNYFSGKEALLGMMQRQRRMIARQILSADIAAEKEPAGKLRAAIRSHLYLSEAMRPWFYFSYMEAKNLDPEERRAAVEAFRMLGHPEGELAICQAALYLATAPKSNRVYEAMGRVAQVIEATGALPVPLHIRNAPTGLMKNLGYGSGYRYAHDFQHAVVAQQDLPEALAGRRFYFPSQRGFEKTLAERMAFWQRLKQGPNSGKENGNRRSESAPATPSDHGPEEKTGTQTHLTNKTT